MSPIRASVRRSKFVLRCFVRGTVALTAGALSAAEAAAEVAPGKSYVYKHSAGLPQTLEVYFPDLRRAGAERVPGLLLFHGGGWSRGSLVQFRAACRYFASRGLVAAADRFLTQLGFLQGASSLPAPTGGESLIKAP